MHFYLRFHTFLETLCISDLNMLYCNVPSTPQSFLDCTEGTSANFIFQYDLILLHHRQKDHGYLCRKLGGYISSDSKQWLSCLHGSDGGDSGVPTRQADRPLLALMWPFLRHSEPLRGSFLVIL